MLLIKHALDKYIKEVNNLQPTDPTEVELENIAKIEDGSASSGTSTGTDSTKVIMTLVNIEEEQTLKNAPHYQVINQKIKYQNPPVNLNLYILFSANHTTYQTALERLSEVITFFQGTSSFSLQTTPPVLQEGELSDFAGIRVLIELYTLTFEQINYLWGSLGGKQVPFVMYRARLVSLQDNRQLAEGKAVMDIEGKGVVK